MRQSLCSRWRIACRKTYSIAIATAFTVAGATPAWSQDPSLIEQEEPRYVLSYVLIVLCIGLGLFLICRPGKRGREVR